MTKKRMIQFECSTNERALEHFSKAALSGATLVHIPVLWRPLFSNSDNSILHLSGNTGSEPVILHSGSTSSRRNTIWIDTADIALQSPPIIILLHDSQESALQRQRIHASHRLMQSAACCSHLILTTTNLPSPSNITLFKSFPLSGSVVAWVLGLLRRWKRGRAWHYHTRPISGLHEAHWWLLRAWSALVVRFEAVASEAIGFKSRVELEQGVVGRECIA